MRGGTAGRGVVQELRGACLLFLRKHFPPPLEEVTLSGFQQTVSSQLGSKVNHRFAT